MADPALYPNVAVVAGWRLASATFAADILETELTKAQFEQEMCALAAAISSDRINSVLIVAVQIKLLPSTSPIERFITPSYALQIARMMKTKVYERAVRPSVKSGKPHERVTMDHAAREAAIMQALLQTFEVVDLKVQSDKYRALMEEADVQIGIVQSEMVREDLEDVEHIYKFVSDYQMPAPEIVNRKSLDLLNEKRAVGRRPPLQASDASFLAATDEFKQEFNLGHIEKWVSAKVPSGVCNDYIPWKLKKLRQVITRLAAGRRPNVVS